MNWDDIRIFLAVARTGQLLGAGRRLGMNHATVSRRISALEQAMETRLIDRRTNGCSLTSEGEAFLLSAERMEAEMLDAQSKVGMVNRSISGTVRIGTPDGFGVAFLAPRLGALADRHPHLKIQLVPVPHAFSLSQREADIAIAIERPVEGRLICKRLTDYTLGLYASSDYLARHGTPQRPEDLRTHRLISYVGRPRSFRRLSISLPSSAGTGALRWRFRARSGRPRRCAPAPASESSTTTLPPMTPTSWPCCRKGRSTGPTGRLRMRAPATSRACAPSPTI